MKKIYTLALFAVISAMSAWAENSEPISLPEGVETEQWLLRYDDMSRMVNVAIVDNQVYLGNLCDELPESYVIGTISEDETKVVFPLTYMGESERLEGPADFVPAEWDYRSQEEIGDEWEDYYIVESYTFDYDAELKVMTASIEASALFVGDSNAVGELAGAYIEYFYEPTLRWVNPESENAPLADPEFLTAYPLEAFGNDVVEFYIPSINSECYPLNTEYVYYVFYLDGEPFTFTPDDYCALEEEMTEIPYDFCDDNYDIYSNGEVHSVSLYTRGYKMVGIKVFYNAPNGELLESAFIEADIEELSEGEISGARIVTDEQPISTDYYDLTGRKVANPQNGLFIKVDTLSKDRKASKVVK